MATARSRPRRPAPIALLSDFGWGDHYAGVIKGVIASIAPEARVIDVTHGIPAHSIRAGALALASAWRYFPRRTVFLAVVDPGVGTARLAVAVETRAGPCFVGPDNGLLSPAVEQAGFRRAVELRSPRFRLSPLSATFHGRDIFAPAAAHLWRGVSIDSFGPKLDRIQSLELPAPRQSGSQLLGTVIYIDGFGNLVSNIDRASFERFRAHFPGRKLSVRIRRGTPIAIRRAYGDASKGTPLAMFGSFELLEVAVSEGSAARLLGARLGTQLTIGESR